MLLCKISLGLSSAISLVLRSAVQIVVIRVLSNRYIILATPSRPRHHFANLQNVTDESLARMSPLTSIVTPSPIDLLEQDYGGHF